MYTTHTMCKNEGADNYYNWRAERAYLVVQLARFFMYLMMHFGPETAPALRANVPGLASSARHQCVATLISNWRLLS